MADKKTFPFVLAAATIADKKTAICGFLVLTERTGG